MEYAIRHSTAEDEILKRLYRETHLRTVYPRMISGHLQGKLLEMFSHMIRPFRILEIGTFTGYSAICLAKGLVPGGLLHTIDINDELTEMVLKYIHETGLAERITLHTGDARKIIPKLRDEFDLVFIDGDKAQYLQYYEQAIQKLRMGGYIIADNVLWGGKVLSGFAGADKELKGIRHFNEVVAADPRVEKILLPFKDGLYILRRIA
jgi:predicted O-methyltransferase YrrM